MILTRQMSMLHGIPVKKIICQFIFYRILSEGDFHPFDGSHCCVQEEPGEDEIHPEMRTSAECVLEGTIPWGDI